MDELGMFQNEVERFELENPDPETLANAFEDAEELLNGLADPEKGLMHLYFDGDSRVRNGKMEVKLEDGTYYPL